MQYVEFETIGEKDFCVYAVVGLRQAWKPRNEFSYWSRPRPDHGITLILCGGAVYTLKSGGEMRVKSGDLVLIPQGSYYTVHFDAAPPGNPDTLLLNFRLNDPSGAPVFFSGGPRVLCRDKENVLFNQMSAGIDAARKGSILRARRCLLSCLEFALDHSGHVQEEPLAPVLEYLSEHIGDSLCVSELARRFAMSEATLRRLFAHRLGVSPVVYLRKQKIRQAKRMLVSAEFSVEDISEQLGFYDVSYFYKIFKSEEGVTPAEYRKNHGP